VTFVRALLVATLFCVSLAQAASAGAEEASLAERLRGLRVAAHRGGYWYPDSNTLSRFDTARRQGADIVETDLQLSKDGVPILFHDGDLRLATNCKGPVAGRTAVELAACHLNGAVHGPETFEALLGWSQGRVVIDAELKDLSVAAPAIELVRRHSAYEWVYFQTRNDLRLYRAVRGLDERVALEATPHGPHADQQLADLLAANDPRLLIIQLHPELLTPRNLMMIRQSGKLSSMDAWRLGTEYQRPIWPFGRRAACSEVFEAGIDIAISNAARSCAEQRDRLALPALGGPS